MKKRIIVYLLTIIILGLFQYNPAYSQGISLKPRFSAGLSAGYGSGFNLQAYGMVSNFAAGFPLAAQLAVSYTSLDPGSPTAARRIFINNATNGIPEENGRILGFEFDLLYPTKLLSMKKAYFFGGPRYSHFRGNFKFVGGNEDFDVTCKQWGLGAGLTSFFYIGGKFDFVLSAGLDYLFGATLSGHDTSYSPDDENVNPREDYTYDDADDAINQPKLKPRITMGINYRF